MTAGKSSRARHTVARKRAGGPISSPRSRCRYAMRQAVGANIGNVNSCNRRPSPSVLSSALCRTQDHWLGKMNIKTTTARKPVRLGSVTGNTWKQRKQRQQQSSTAAISAPPTTTSCTTTTTTTTKFTNKQQRQQQQRPQRSGIIRGRDPSPSCRCGRLRVARA